MKGDLYAIKKLLMFRGKVIGEHEFQRKSLVVMNSGLQAKLNPDKLDPSYFKQD